MADSPKSALTQALKEGDSGASGQEPKRDKKGLTKAERREIQEKQRAEKAARIAEGGPAGGKKGGGGGGGEKGGGGGGGGGGAKKEKKTTSPVLGQAAGALGGPPAPAPEGPKKEGKKKDGPEPAGEIAITNKRVRGQSFASGGAPSGVSPSHTSDVSGSPIDQRSSPGVTIGSAGSRPRVESVSTGKRTPGPQGDSSDHIGATAGAPRPVARAPTRVAVVERVVDAKEHPLFSHLPAFKRHTSQSLGVGFSLKEIHPEVIQAGLKMGAGVISGSNARCMATLMALKQVVEEYETPPNKTLKRDLEVHLRPSINFLMNCRPAAISMRNAVKWVKHQIVRLPEEMPDTEAKAEILDKIETFVHERIVLAEKVIAENGSAKIKDGDVLLLYDASHAVELTLNLAHEKGIRFRLVVVDSRPLLEGRALLTRLTAQGMECTYILINAVSYILKEVTKVFLGASALMLNGTMLAHCGAASVANAAHAAGVPVMVFCETYKFCEKTYLDSIVYNELGNPDDLVDDGNMLSDWRTRDNLRLLHLVYDLTPIECISVVVTEVGLVPPTSVPVIIREYHETEGDVGE